MTDIGHPEECNVYSYYQVFAPKEAPAAHEWCSKALKGCVDCKKILSTHINKDLEPIRERRAQLEKDKSRIEDILKEGTQKARTIAQKTMQEVREAVY
jgi:tryptophanyl-tRNA synthetase